MPVKVHEYFQKRTLGDKEVGIEIEMEGTNLTPPNLNYWDVKHDGSLRGPEAVEYVLRTPASRNRVKARLQYLKNELKKNKAVLAPSERCGIHVHINCLDLSIEDVYKFMTMFLLFENLFVRWCGKSREGNLFCLRAMDAEYILPMLIKAKNMYGFYQLHSDNLRYSAMNVTALKKFGSLEFRAMATGPDLEEIHKWVRMLLRLKDKSLSYDSEQQFLEEFSQDGGRAFAHKIMGPHHYERLFCSDMDQLMEEGARLAQHLAYSPIEPEEKAQIEEKYKRYRDQGAAIKEKPRYRPKRVKAKPMMNKYRLREGLPQPLFQPLFGDEPEQN